MGAQPDSQKHPCEYCGALVGSGAFMYIQRHKRNGDQKGMIISNGMKHAAEGAVNAAYAATKLELSAVQNKLGELQKLQDEEIRLTRLLNGLEVALTTYNE
jgi:hypothetical protein